MKRTCSLWIVRANLNVLMAEGTAGVGPAGGAEKATAAKPEALVPWAAQGGHVHELPPDVLP